MPAPPLVVIEAPGKLPAARAALSGIGVDAHPFATLGVLFDLPEDQCALDAGGAPTEWHCLRPEACARLRMASEAGLPVVAWTDADDAGEWIASQVQALAPAGFTRLRTSAMSVSRAEWEARAPSCDGAAVARHLARRLAHRAIGFAGGGSGRLRIGPSATPALASLAESPLVPERVERLLPCGTVAHVAQGGFVDGDFLPHDAPSQAAAALAAVEWQAADVPALNGPELALALALARGGGAAPLWRDAQAAYMRGDVSYHRTTSAELAPWQHEELDRRFAALFRPPQPPEARSGAGSPHGAWVPLRNPEASSDPLLNSQLCDHWLERSEGSELRSAGGWIERRRPRRRSPYASWRQSADGRSPRHEIDDALWRRLLGLATPSGIAGLARRLRPLVDAAGRLNRLGWQSLRRAEAVAPGLLDPDCGSRIEALLSNGEMGVLERVAACVREADARPHPTAGAAAPAPPVWAEVPLR